MMEIEQATSNIKDILQTQAEIKKFTQWQLESIDIVKQMTESLGWFFEIKQQPDGSSLFIVTKLVDNPSLNKEGVISLVQNLFKIVNKNTFLANLDRNEAKMILIDHMIAILEDLVINFDYYDIDDLGTLEKVRSTVENMSEIALSRGREGVTLNYLKTVQHLIERIGIGEKGGEMKIV